MDDRTYFRFCYECGTTFSLDQLDKGFCPVCMKYEFAKLIPVSDDESIGPGISIALMDSDRDLWWDELIDTDEGPYIALVKLPPNCGFIPRWLVDFKQAALIDPLTGDKAVRQTLGRD